MVNGVKCSNKELTEAIDILSLLEAAEALKESFKKVSTFSHTFEPGRSYFKPSFQLVLDGWYLGLAIPIQRPGEVTSIEGEAHDLVSSNQI